MSKWNFPQKGGHMDSPSGIYFQTMNKRTIEERLKQNDVIIIPVGSTENHGNAGPVGEDTFIVTRIAEMVAQQTGCTVSEPIWFGSHPFHHIGQPLTVPIPDDVFTDHLRHIISGYWNSGFRKQIFISMHGQEYAIPTALQEWGKKYQVPAVLYFVDLPRVMGQTLMDQAHGGPFQFPFQHGDEAETSISLALFPELCDMAHAQDTKTGGFLPAGHVDRGGDIYGYPIPGHCAVGNVGIECITHPEGVLGKATLADAEKARACVEKVCDYLEKLMNDLLATFPVGVLPDAKLMSQRSKEEIDALLKGPLAEGGKHLYTIAWPS
jgi:creatinine amidohydrolase